MTTSGSAVRPGKRAYVRAAAITPGWYLAPGPSAIETTGPFKLVTAVARAGRIITFTLADKTCEYGDIESMWHIAQMKISPGTESNTGASRPTAGIQNRESKKMTDTSEKKGKVVIQYAIDGRPITNPSVNSLSGVAYFYCKGVIGERPRISVEELEAILKKAGITEPRTTAFSFKLANGKTISATVGKLAARVPRVKKEDQPEAVAERQASKNRVARQAAAKEESKKLKEWKDAGEKGTPPPTPALDELRITTARKPSGGVKKAAQVSKAIADAKKAPAKKAAATKAPVAKKASTRPPVNRTKVTPMPKKATASASKAKAS